MNYRHVFHAGNHTEVFKHGALVIALRHFAQKQKPFFVLDSHAGVGAYDLTSDEALRTAEAEHGVGRVFGRPLAAAPEFTSLLEAMNGHGSLTVYPGSPDIILSQLGPADRLVACELHPEDHAKLRARYFHDPRVAVHHRDGYEAIRALLPPPERRGLVFIDPPYEQRTETDRIVKSLSAGLRRWRGGTFIVWYPIKDAVIGDRLAVAVVAGLFPAALRAEFIPFAMDGLRLAGSGLIIVNAPYRMDEHLEALCRDLGPLLGGPDWSWSVRWLTAP